jgi:CheY-like chemotaxis protein
MTTLDISNVRILVVEDDKDYLPRLIRRLEKKGYQGIDVASDEFQAKKKLDEKDYDVIVADMYLYGNTSGGFVVLEEVKKRKITSIVIILTANDKVEDCRRALRGCVCWDYIAKTMEDRSALSELHDSIQKALLYLNHWGNRQDERWIKENWDELLKNYPNQHIAVLNHSVLAAADSQEALEKYLTEKQLPLFLPVFHKVEVMAIADMIPLGESETLEFKRTYQYNPEKPNKKDERLRFACLKTIVAFLNSKGGTLLIGVEDKDGSLYGMENDFEVANTKSQNKDGFLLTLTNAINDNIGVIFTEKNIRVYFENLEEKEICIVKVTPSEKPAFLKKERKGLFFIRTNNETKELDAQEILEHLGV